MTEDYREKLRGDLPLNSVCREWHLRDMKSCSQLPFQPEQLLPERTFNPDRGFLPQGDLGNVLTTNAEALSDPAVSAPKVGRLTEDRCVTLAAVDSGNHEQPRLYDHRHSMSRAKRHNPQDFSTEGLELCRWLLRLRAELGDGVRPVDQLHLASVLNINQASVSKWESDKARPNTNNYFEMARLAKTEATRNFFIVMALNTMPAMMKLIEEMTPEQKQAFCGMVGIEAVLPDPWNGEERRRAVGDAVPGKKRAGGPHRLIIAPKDR